MTAKVLPTNFTTEISDAPTFEARMFTRRMSYATSNGGQQ
jgi:hypothetical protein